MSPVVVAVSAAMLLVGAALAVVRIERGPSMLDRTIALDVLTATLVLLACMPTGATTFTLSQEFDGDGHLAAAVVAVSTLLALVTVSVFSALVV